MNNSVSTMQPAMTVDQVAAQLQCSRTHAFYSNPRRTEFGTTQKEKLMPEQQTDMFEVDHVGRKAQLLGLTPDNEAAVNVIEEAKRLYNGFARYQIGLVDCEMKRLSASDRSAELTRLWQDTFISYTNLGAALERFRPIDEAIEGQIQAQVAAERTENGDTKKLDAIDNEFRDFMGPGNNPPEVE